MTINGPSDISPKKSVKATHPVGAQRRETVVAAAMVRSATSGIDATLSVSPFRANQEAVKEPNQG
jgi:hypothetical protein